MVPIILLYALFATSFSMGKILLQYSPPIFLNGCRMFIAGSILLLYQYFNPREKFHFKKSHFGSTRKLFYSVFILGTTYAFGRSIIYRLLKHPSCITYHHFYLHIIHTYFLKNS